MTCAETTVWGIMEYFGNKYSEYKIVLPSKIISALSDISYERQMPSQGLTVEKVSFALRQFDFGTRIYSEKAFGNELKRIFYYYIDSGIPFIAAIKNDSLGHAITVIGYETLNIDNIKCAQRSYKIKKQNGKEINIIDFADIPRRYVAMDDNFPPYTLARFEFPTEYYSDPSFKNCKITSIVVPLYTKIYLEALQARSAFQSYLAADVIDDDIDNEILLRLFLTSSRSYKQFIAMSQTINKDVKELIMLTAMPKFIWVAELSTKMLFVEGKAAGLMVLDATEANHNVTDSLLFIAYKNKFIYSQNRTYKAKEIPRAYFDIYINNLKGNLIYGK